MNTDSMTISLLKLYPISMLCWTATWDGLKQSSIELRIHPPISDQITLHYVELDPTLKKSRRMKSPKYLSHKSSINLKPIG